MSRIESQLTFDEWALDVTLADQGDCYAFVPICGDEVVWGVTMIQERSPGVLTGVVSQHGLEHAQQWAAEHPTWQVDFCQATDLTEVA